MDDLFTRETRGGFYWSVTQDRWERLTSIAIEERELDALERLERVRREGELVKQLQSQLQFPPSSSFSSSLGLMSNHSYCFRLDPYSGSIHPPLFLRILSTQLLLPNPQRDPYFEETVQSPWMMIDFLYFIFFPDKLCLTNWTVCTTLLQSSSAKLYPYTTRRSWLDIVA